jgi:hypothetical protein
MFLFARSLHTSLNIGKGCLQRRVLVYAIVLSHIPTKLINSASILRINTTLFSFKCIYPIPKDGINLIVILFNYIWYVSFIIYQTYSSNLVKRINNYLSRLLLKYCCVFRCINCFWLVTLYCLSLGFILYTDLLTCLFYLVLKFDIQITRSFICEAFMTLFTGVENPNGVPFNILNKSGYY